jgi:hypothetical protein
LDHHIGLYDACNDLKHALWNAIDITTNAPLDRYEIDRLIQINNVFPPITDQLIAVSTMEECLALIDKHYHKKIFLITSGTFGRYLVPRVIEEYPYIEKIFVFCANICLHMDWALDFTDNLLMFDFHKDLLTRVVYDIGMYYLQQGIISSDSDDHRRALDYFYIAKKLVMRTNFIFQPNFSFSLRTIEELITNEEARLPPDIVQNIRNHLSYH